MKDWNILSKYFAVPKTKSPAEVALSAALLNERRIDRNALAKAKRLALKHGINIDADAQNGWWVGSALDDTPADPLDGNHFSSDGREVLAAVETLAKALT